MAADYEASVREYHRDARQSEIQADAERKELRALEAAEAAGHIKSYVAWPPKQHPFDGTPKRPIPGMLSMTPRCQSV